MKDEENNTGNSNSKDPERIAYLVAGFLRQTLSEKEHDELDAWTEASGDNQQLFEELIDPKAINEGLKQRGQIDTEAALKKIKRKLKFAHSREEKTHKKRRIIQYTIAATVLLLISLTLFFVLKDKNNKADNPVTQKQDLPGGGNRATLQLANGKLIDLANVKNGLLDSTGGSDVLKTAEGQLSYESGNKAEGKGEHILTTPAGGQYSVTLPDGTRVWLNASSSLKYPVLFDEKERVVELTGEGYFEVRPHPKPLSEGEGLSKTPFVVMLRNGAKVEVVGTHFNINAYDDEAVIETTLLEGKVVVGSRESGVGSRELVPGQQARMEVSGERSVVSSEWSVLSGADTSEAVAWKNGKFQYKNATIETVMRQVARWYDAEIIYEGKVDYHFTATIYRKEPVSKLLRILEETNRVHFSIDNKKIIVKP